jgi:hypothetical protein
MGYGTSVDPLGIPSIPAITMVDLEPLPWSESGVNVNASPLDEASDPSSFPEPEVESFDDVMSEFCQNMGVAV